MSTFFELNLDSLFNSFAGGFCDHGPLRYPVKSKKLRLTSKGKIELTTVSAGNSVSNEKGRLPGTVRVNNDKAVLESYGGVKLELRGILPSKLDLNTNFINGVDECVQISSVDEIYGEFKEQCIDDFQIEYISNLVKNYHFPDSFNKEVESSTKLSFKSEEIEFKVEDNSKQSSFSRSALKLNIGNIKLYLVYLGGDSINNAIIIYEQVQPEIVRRKIRDCISFCLGKPLHYHGYLILNSSNQYVRVSYKSNNSKVNKDSYHAQMPTPLGNIEWGLGGPEANRLVNALYDNYERYNLQHVFWGYWHALDAPIHIAGVHFGACIEAFQSAYTSQNKDDFPNKLIDKENWRAFKEEAINAANKLEIPETELRILLNKINNLNQTPQSVSTERFFNKLGIKLSELESSAWKERNNAAHGKSVDSDLFSVQIRNIKILKCLLHRMLLIATNGSNYYYDYYSYGYPIKLLADSIIQPID